MSKSTSTTKRRVATDADLTVGTTVYRGETAQKPFTVSGVYGPEEHVVVTRYTIGSGAAGHASRSLWVEIPAGQETPMTVWDVYLVADGSVLRTYTSFQDAVEDARETDGAATWSRTV